MHARIHIHIHTPFSTKIAAIGPTTAEALTGAGLPPSAVASKPSPDSLLQAMLNVHRWCRNMSVHLFIHYNHLWSCQQTAMIVIVTSLLSGFFEVWPKAINSSGSLNSYFQVLDWKCIYHNDDNVRLMLCSQKCHLFQPYAFLAESNILQQIGL